MSNKAIWAIAAVVVLAVAGCLIAQKTDSRPGVTQVPGQDSRAISQDGGMSVSQERRPLAPDEQEKRILNVLEDMLHDQYSAMLSVPPEDGKVLRLLTEATGARHVVEIGTSNGYASIWFCLALRTTGGKLTTFEIDAQRAALARENFKRAGVDKLVTLIEGNAHEKVKLLKGPIDIVFIDADKDGYLDYLNKLLPLVRPGGLILAHDTTDASSLMQDYLEAVTTNPELETVFLHKQTTGIGVTLKKRHAE
jgi:caffeoyl-CoA O-methyltransferase